MSCNVPAREIFRASRSFYLWIQLLWLMLCTLPVVLVIASKKPSRACGPFAHREWFYTVMTEEIEKRIDAGILGYARYVASPGIVIPIIIFLVLIIYFLVSLVRGLRDSNTDLQQQLLHERTEEKKKIFELAGGGQNSKEKAEQRDREKRQMVQHLTEIEEKRREPWRQFNGGAQGASLLASDSSSSSSSSSCSSDAEDNAGAPDGVSRRVPKPSSTAETVAIAAHLRRSLGSLEEQLDEELEAPAAPRLPSRPGAIGGREMVHSVSSNFPRSRGTRQSPSINSLDVHSNVVEMATPDEIRMISASASRNDLRASTHRALATTREEEASQRSSTETAGSLKMATADFNMADQNEVQPTRKKTPHSSAANTSKGFEATEVVPTFQAWPSLEEEEGPSGGGRKSLIRSPLAFFNRALGGKQPAQPPPPPPSSLPLSMSSGMPSGLPETAIGRRIPPAPTSAPPPVPPHHHSTATAIVASASTSHSSSTEGASDTSRGITPARGRLPDNPSPQRRFRISVSPTRRMQPAASDDDSDNGSHRSSVGAGVRRYVVKQESAAPSQSSLVAPAPPATSPRAPIVNFDDDDSPRIDDATKKLLGMPPSSGK